MRRRILLALSAETKTTWAAAAAHLALSAAPTGVELAGAPPSWRRSRDRHFRWIDPEHRAIVLIEHEPRLSPPSAKLGPAPSGRRPDQSRCGLVCGHRLHAFAPSWRRADREPHSHPGRAENAAAGRSGQPSRAGKGYAGSDVGGHPEILLSAILRGRSPAAAWGRAGRQAAGFMWPRSPRACRRAAGRSATATYKPGDDGRGGGGRRYDPNQATGRTFGSWSATIYFLIGRNRLAVAIDWLCRTCHLSARGSSLK